jgi:hypothetical protein
MFSVKLVAKIKIERTGGTGLLTESYVKDIHKQDPKLFISQRHSQTLCETLRMTEILNNMVQSFSQSVS